MSSGAIIYIYWQYKEDRKGQQFTSHCDMLYLLYCVAFGSVYMCKSFLLLPFTDSISNYN